MKIFKYLSLAVVTAFLCTGDLSASINLDVIQGSDPGFRYSYVHSANGTGTNKSASGLLSRFLGTIQGRLDSSMAAGDVFVIENSSLTFSNVFNENANNFSSIVLTSGVLKLSGDGGGFIDYTIDSGLGSEENGTFYFNNVHESGPANTGSLVGNDIESILWGNNWMYGPDSESSAALQARWDFLLDLDGFTGNDSGRFGDSNNFMADQGAAGGTRRGMDLYARGNVPEPTSMMIWMGIGLVGTLASRRRRR